jgi:hypothetical protein
MYKLLLLFLIIIFTLSSQELLHQSGEQVNKQIKSPSEFLGYELGQQFTAHHEILAYLTYLSKSKAEFTKFNDYGKTYETRPLTTLIISNKENINNLNQIFSLNKELTLNPEKNISVPSIIWLAYGVHGNESSSAEASMLTAFHLLATESQRNTDFLKNAVIVIDPLVNPDGRERYVNWFRSTRGLNPNADMNGREHFEPWPGGRVNHYYFDLNRDWTWASQIETKERLKLYHKIKPHVYIDFHEMYYESTYFFFPPTDPINPLMPKNINDLYRLFAERNSSYFDKQKKTYYTKESFDLFYPGYGDSYPSLIGSLGMTYEQAGHSRGGLIAQRSDETNLTLNERLYNHYTSSIASIETAVNEKEKILTYFKSYFRKSIKESKDEPFKYYIPEIHSASYQEMIDLLKLHDISVYYSKKDQFIKTDKHNSYRLLKGQAIIPVQQNQFTLLKTLFDNELRIPDTAFYDVSSWSLPLSFNVPVYQSKFGIEWAENLQKAEIKYKKTSYAYIFEPKSFQSLRFLNILLNKNLNLMTNLSEFETSGTKVTQSSIIISKLKNLDLDESWLFNLANEYDIEFKTIERGLSDKGIDLGSEKIRTLKKLKLAILSGEEFSANRQGALWFSFDRFIETSPTMIDIKSLSRIQLNKYNTLIIPSSRSLSDVLNENSFTKIKDWVSNGGHLILMERSINYFSDEKTNLLSFKNKKADEKDDKKKTEYVAYTDRSNYYNKQSFPGAILEVKIDQSHPIAVGIHSPFYTLKTSSSSYELSDNTYSDIAVFNSNKSFGFIPEKAKELLNNSKFYSIKHFGSGVISSFNSDPFFRMFQLGGLKLIMNDVFFGKSVH